MAIETKSVGVDRRGFMATMSTFGVAGTLFPGVLWAKAQEAPEITKEVLAEAEKIAGIEFTEEERDLMLEGLQRMQAQITELRTVPIPNDVAPALVFQPSQPPLGFPQNRRVQVVRESVDRPADLEEVAAWPVTRLSELVRTRKVTSTELTSMYLDRLKRYGPRLECVVSLTENLAHQQSRQADAEIATGHYRGPLHGIPWGAKDLLAVTGYPTTWGAAPYQDQTLTRDAQVVSMLRDAGAVLVAKLTLGALAMGDVWFGGKTRNPWNLEQGSSGSSAGSASATVAGLVGFSIGTETLGSIVSPSTRCGASGHRPTFGRVSKAGAMALSWSMDKIGPICRSAADCALVMEAINGSDSADRSTRDVPFAYDERGDLAELRLGYLQSAFEGEQGSDFDRAALATIRELGVELIPVELPDQFPLGPLRMILTAEAGAAFDELTRSGRDDLLVRQDQGAWPTTFRSARFIPAVEYIQANRVRTMVAAALDAALDGVDAFITPSYARDLLLMTNLTGHPVSVVPHGFRDDGTPASISFVGNLWQDGAALRMASAFQSVTDFHLRRPPEFA